ncbi:MAG: hypothetical protein K9N55_08010 [Phycisphaerae bacterium]|nr:hypothetical protein [Phycisphaerae bacterium]
MAKSERNSACSSCHYWLHILALVLIWACTCMAEAAESDPNRIGQDSLSEAIDPNLDLLEESEPDRDFRSPENQELNTPALDDSNSASARPPDASSEVVRKGNRLQEVLEKIRRLPIWTSNRMVAFFIAIGAVVVCLIACLFLNRTLRTRRSMHIALTKDSDIDEFLIIYNLTEKVLYFPSIIASLLAAAAMYLNQAGLLSLEPEIVGRIWFPIVFVNFLIEEYNIRLRGIIATVVFIAFLLLWLHLASYLMGFLRLFTHITLVINGTGYLLMGLIGFAAVIISWTKGLFYYVTITPNYMDLQEGPSESGEQISREDYNTRVDTSNFLERLLGFGKVEITFKHGQRHPIRFLVWGIGKKAQKLEKVRAKFVIDHKPGLRSAGADNAN